MIRIIFSYFFFLRGFCIYTQMCNATTSVLLLLLEAVVQSNTTLAGSGIKTGVLGSHAHTGLQRIQFIRYRRHCLSVIKL